MPRLRREDNKMSVINENMPQRFQQAVQTHRQNIQRSIQHRLEVATAKGDLDLIRQLQAEVEYYN